MQPDPDDRRSVFQLRVFMRRHLIPILIAVSLCALILFSIADCFDCEFPSPWRRNDAIYEIRVTVFTYWLVGSSLLVGFLRQRFGWVVPIAIVLIACATELLGGVELWSLINNEGPVMLIIGGSVGLISFFAGLIIRMLIERLCKSRSVSRS